MSGQSSEFNGEVPPRQGPEPSIRSSGDLITLYQARQGGESFPVLQAFQEYIDAERKQARKRVVQLSIGFAAILGVVVVGFLAAGVSMLRNMTDMQNRLVEVVAAKSSVPAPVQVQPVAAPVAPTSPVLEESIREMSRVLARMQEHKVPESAVPAEPARPPVQEAKPDPAVEALRAELLDMKQQSRMMEEQLLAMRRKEAEAGKKEASSKVVEEALALARKTAEEKARADKIKQDQAAAEAARRQAEEEKARLARVEEEKNLALKMAAARADEDRKAVTESVKAPPAEVAAPVAPEEENRVVSRYPEATKDAPAVKAGVEPPKPPPAMAAASIQLKSKDGASVPWRIFVPE